MMKPNSPAGKYTMRFSSLILLALWGCGDAANEPEKTDADGDGVFAENDCDDNDASRYPGAPDEFGDALDTDCDGVDGVDADGDGVPSVTSGGNDCDDNDPAVQGEDLDNDGSAWCADCDDNDSAVFPGAADVCNDIDDDCDGDIDTDNSGVGTCSADFVATRAVDVLLVVDNSCSMSEEQAALSTASSLFLDEFLNTDADFHLGVISTDPDDNGRLVTVGGNKWIDAQTPDPYIVAANMIQIGTDGSANEVGRDAVTAALTIQTALGGYNEGFYRDNAHLDIVALSDENDHSTLTQLGGFIAWLQGLNPPSYDTFFHAIVTPVGGCPSGAEVGTDYLDVNAALGGVTESICAPDYGPAVTDIVNIHTGGDLDRFPLDVTPNPDTLAADVTDFDGNVTHYDNQALSWDATEGKVVFPEPVPVGHTVTIWYALAQ